MRRVSLMAELRRGREMIDACDEPTRDFEGDQNDTVTGARVPLTPNLGGTGRRAVPGCEDLVSGRRTLVEGSMASHTIRFLTSAAWPAPLRKVAAGRTGSSTQSSLHSPAGTSSRDATRSVWQGHQPALPRGSQGSVGGPVARHWGAVGGRRVASTPSPIGALDES